MKFEVGQVVYILLSEKAKIAPVQIIEELTRKTLGGEETNYIVRYGKDGKQFELSKLEGQIYVDLEKLKNYMFDNALKTIEKMCNVAVTSANQWYGTAESIEITQQIAQESERKEIYVELPDGTKAKLKA